MQFFFKKYFPKFALALVKIQIHENWSLSTFEIIDSNIGKINEDKSDFKIMGHWEQI